MQDIIFRAAKISILFSRKSCYNVNMQLIPGKLYRVRENKFFYEDKEPTIVTNHFLPFCKELNKGDIILFIEEGDKRKFPNVAEHIPFYFLHKNRKICWCVTLYVLEEMEIGGTFDTIFEPIEY